MRRLIARLYMRLTGWRLVGQVPHQSAVIIGAFHTTNWDFTKLVAAKWAWRFEPSWIAKQELFRPPLGWILRSMGGIAVRRDRPGHVVEQMAERFQESDLFLLVITPEGTRSATPYWKSGFYHIARVADVPISLGFVDYATKTFGIRGTVALTGDISADMDAIREFYRPIVGKKPDNQGPVRLREETASARK